MDREILRNSMTETLGFLKMTPIRETLCTKKKANTFTILGTSSCAFIHYTLHLIR